MRQRQLVALAQFGKNAYPYTMTFRELVGKYRYLLKPNLPLVTPATSRQKAIDFCEKLLEGVGVTKDEYLIGSSRVFIRCVTVDGC